MTDIASLAYKVDSSDLDRAEKALDRNTEASKRTETASGRLSRAWQSMTRSLGALVSVKAMVTGALSAMTIGMARQINQSALMAQQIGLSTEALTGLRYAAEQMSTVTGGQFDMALRRMTRRIAEAAAGGGPAADAIKSMGLEARELARLKPDEQFRRLSDAMRGTADQGQKLRNTMAIFDTEGMPLVTMMNQGADAIREFEGEADRLGITIDTRTAAAARMFTKELVTLRGAGQGLKTRIAAELMPTLAALTGRFSESAKGASGLDEAARVAGAGLKIIGSIAALVAGIFNTVGQALGGVAAGLVAFFSGNFQEAWEITKMTNADIVRNMAQTGDNIKAIWKDVEIDESILGEAVAQDVQDAQDAIITGGSQIVSEAEKVYQQIEQVIGRIKRDVMTFGMTDEQVILFDMRMDGATLEQLERARELLDRRELLREEQRLTDELADAGDRRWRSFERVLGGIRDERQLLQMSADDQEIWNNLKWAGVDATDALGQAIIRETQELQRTRKVMGEQIEAMDSVRGAGKGLFSDIGKGAKPFDAALAALERFRDRLVDIISERLIDQLFGQSGQAGGGSWGNAIGSFFSSMFGGGRRHGGPVRRDRMYEVNEGGIPELLDTGSRRYLLPGSDGQVTPIAAGAGAGGAMATPQININVQGNANVESATARQNQSGGFDIDVILKQVDSHIAGGIATGTGQTGRAMKSRYGLKEVV